MENFHDARPDLLSSNTLEVDEQSSNYLKDAGQWAKAIAVIACIVGGLATLGILAFGSIFNTSLGYSMQGYLVIIIGAVLIVLGIALIGIINLFRFSNGMAAGIGNQDAAAFDNGVSGLKNYFILLGVLTLLFTFITVVQFLTT